MARSTLRKRLQETGLLAKSNADGGNGSVCRSRELSGIVAGRQANIAIRGGVTEPDRRRVRSLRRWRSGRPGWSRRDKCFFESKGRELSYGQDKACCCGPVGRGRCVRGAGCLRADRRADGDQARQAAGGRSAQPDADPGLEHHVADRRHQPVGDPRLHPSGRQCLHVRAADVLRHLRRQVHPVARHRHGLQRRLHRSSPSS